MHDGLRQYVSRFLTKCLYEMLPAALASIIGGLVFTYYHAAPTPVEKPAAASDASAGRAEEAIQMVREEHALIVDFLKAQQAAALEAEKARAKEFDQARSGAAGEKIATLRATEASLAERATALAKRHAAQARPVARPAGKTETRVADTRPAGEPLAITPAATFETPPLVAKRGPIDRVLAAAGEWKDRALSTLTDIPVWIGNAGERIFGADRGSVPSAHLVSSVSLMPLPR
jgi:hypothetical protein